MEKFESKVGHVRFVFLEATYCAAWSKITACRHPTHPVVPEKRLGLFSGDTNDQAAADNSIGSGRHWYKHGKFAGIPDIE
jgi:hypothetical protein